MQGESIQDGARSKEPRAVVPHDGVRSGTSVSPPDLGPCKLLAEQIRDILLFVSPTDGRILDVNPAAIAAYGYAREALLAMHVADLRSPDQRDPISSQLAAADRDGILFETIHLRADGTPFPVEISARGANIAGTRVITSLVRDISQRKAAEEKLQRSHDTFYNLIQNSPFGIYVVDSRFRLAQVSAGSQKVFAGVRPLIGRDFAEVLRVIWPEPFASDVVAKFRHTLATGEAYHSPRTVEHRADVDDVEAYDWRLDRITLPDGEFGVVCYFYDLSERRRYEAALRESQERQRIAVESARLGVFEWHIADDRAVWENDRPYEIFGQPRHLGPVGREAFIHDFVLPEDREAFQGQLAHLVASGHRVNLSLRIRRPDGEIRWIEITGHITRDPAGVPTRMLGVISDITERMTAEFAVRESEERFRSLANAMPQLVWTANNHGAVTYYNSQASKYSGLTQSAEGIWRWEPLVHPDDIAPTADAWRAAVLSGKTYQCEHRVKMADGHYRWHLSRAFRSHDGTQWFGTATDVHELKQTEDALRASQRELARNRDDLELRVQERTQELTTTHDRLRFSERFAMMGTLAAGLGHDLGNLLVHMRVRLESLSRAALDPQARDDVESITSAAEYLRRLAQGLRLLSLDPDRDSRHETTELAGWWSDVHGVLKSSLPRGVEIVSDVAPDAGVARISKPALTQAVFNLFQNAGDAIRGRGRGAIRIRSHTADAWVHVIIEDDGPGMSDDVKARCMEPFFTTKSRGASTGLGLALVDRLIRDAGGRVELESEVAKGTRFTLVLPVAQPEPPDRSPRFACLIDIKDPRVHSIIKGELATLNVEIRAWASRLGNEAAAITDDASKLAELAEETSALLLAATPSSRTNVRVLGDRPNITQIRDAIRAIIAEVAATRPER